MVVITPTRGDGPRRNAWYSKMAENPEMAEKEEVRSNLMIGDSIVNNMFREKKLGMVWERIFSTSPPMNFGFGGDGVEHVQICALKNGQLPQAECVIIHCGTNNIGNN